MSLIPHFQITTEVAWNSLFKTNLYLNQVGQVMETLESILYAHHCKIFFLITPKHIDLLWKNAKRHTTLCFRSKFKTTSTGH